MTIFWVQYLLSVVAVAVLACGIYKYPQTYDDRKESWRPNAVRSVRNLNEMNFAAIILIFLGCFVPVLNTLAAIILLLVSAFVGCGPTWSEVKQMFKKTKEVKE
ncbi:hypothetical protein FDI24_gp157 [Acidovorax phage ACP17]|uniref:Uncharacterized protein n=1 Tax=Acidovorax phage ACP17 TaxID=2010329 RepID=A0A218M317_9CAUD|nr:hypothetical protein FDI24_gp157 [Acidovorax phage ACP17]ASD50439.1 hypothetical protein [Acidovorax phage ACP17]